LPVPGTTALPRRLAPFRFGQPTGTGELWLRTCPVEQVPGRFTTHRGWLDPFALLQKEDPEGTALASVLCQEGVDALHSGAALTDADDRPLIEGVRGRGDDFMVGKVGPERLPPDVLGSVRALLTEAQSRLGPVRMEWAADAERVWVVQLHAGPSPTSGLTIYPGAAKSYRRFDTRDGLEPLRALIAEVRQTGEGIILVGDIGVTSHMGDVLRKACVPSRVESAPG
jgi:hypothetical protein